MLSITKELLANARVEEGPLFESRFLNEDTGASDELYNALDIDEVIQSVRKGVHGYVIPASSSAKYHRELINLVVEHRGFYYALGVQVKDGVVFVNSFINQSKVEWSMNRVGSFPQFYL